MNDRRTLTQAWIALLALSFIATLVSLGVGAGLNRHVAGVSILVLAVLKARVILSRYLGLAAAPRWRAGIFTALSLFALVLLALYLGPLSMAMLT